MKKEILWGLGGLIVGAAGATLSLRRYYETKINDKLIEEYEKAAQQYKDEEVKKAVNLSEELKENLKAHLQNRTPANDENYEDLADKYSEEESDGESQIPEEIITEDDFQNVTDEYDALTLKYFEGDDTLTDNNDRPFTESQAEDILGNLDVLNYFGIRGAGPQFLYVANHDKKAYLEIIKSQNSYTEEILGIPEDDGVVENPKFRGDDE